LRAQASAFAELKTNDDFFRAVKSKKSPNYHRPLDGKTIFHLAVKKRYDIWEDCLENRGIDVNVPDYRGRRALHDLCAQNEPKMIRVLLRERPEVDVNARDWCDNVPLHLATTRSVILQFLEHPVVNRDAVNCEGKTPIMAFMDGVVDPLAKTGIVMLFGQKGADLARRDSRGRSLLHALIEANHRWEDTGERSRLRRLVELLIDELGLDIDALNYEGKSALEVAASRQQWVATKELLKAGARVALPTTHLGMAGAFLNGVGVRRNLQRASFYMDLAEASLTIDGSEGASSRRRLSSSDGDDDVPPPPKKLKTAHS
jgi:ankyrin repeat protein